MPLLSFMHFIAPLPWPVPPLPAPGVGIGVGAVPPLGTGLEAFELFALVMASEALAMAVAQVLADPSIIGAAKAELASRTRNVNIDMPRLGAWHTMTKAPATFWDASWTEVTP